MKKWILKKEITEILNTYSVRRDEFEAIKKEGFEYYYKSKFARGYYIHISEEIEKGGKDIRDIATGRIIVTHTKANGRITYNDIWDRDKEGKLEFRFRNPWDQPFSDAEYIRNLEEDIEKMREQYHKLTDDTEYKELKREKLKLEMQLDEQEEKYQKLIDEKEELERNLHEQFQNFHDLISENESLKRELEKLKGDFGKDNSDHLQKEIEKLHQENQKLKNEKKHNARGAGRKPSQERINAIEEVRQLLESGTSEHEIMSKLGISKATFYRYKRNINN